MKIEGLLDKIKTAIIKADRATAKQTTLPALSGIFLSAEKNHLDITATNLDLGVKLSIPVRVETPGEAVVPGSTLSGLLTQIPTGKKVVIEKKTVLFL